MVLATALESLERDGLKLDLRALNMNDLIRNADVSRSTCRRIWPSNKQFYLELIEAMVEPDRPENAALDRETMAVAEAVLEQYGHLVVDVTGRRHVLREMIRQAVGHTFERAHRKLAWRTYAALTATLPSLTDDNHRNVRDVLAEAEARDIQRMAAFYQRMQTQLGLRFQPGYDVDLFASTATSLMAGLVMRRFMSQADTVDRVLLAGVDGVPVEWHPAALAFMAVIDGMTEPDPDWLSAGPRGLRYP